ncbi:MAG TPA: TIGR03619 family F420-dependent LLM class oxidoreductase [Amycolatopsis sp.]|nr:TIGR03619 family F420-dependent LLM class oxidoreductase [Amycolatopsis sp.]
MRFTVEHPVGQPDCDPALYGPAGLPAFARAAENARFDVLAFTEHPAPSLKWLRNGGHATLDPVAALSFVAACTSRISIMPYLMVLPYRNPLLAAKSIVSMDVLSSGRLILGAGGGYLRSEFSALGVEFEERGPLFDEALEVLRAVCATDEFRYEGRHFTARGVAMSPAPVQRPHPPVWIGGNGLRPRRRIARAAQGWCPLITTAEGAQTTRTAAITSVAELADAIKELHDLVAEAGRDPASIGVQVQSPYSRALGADVSVEEVRDHIGELTEAGVTQFVTTTPSNSTAAALEGLARFGEEIIARQP